MNYFQLNIFPIKKRRVVNIYCALLCFYLIEAEWRIYASVNLAINSSDNGKVTFLLEKLCFKYKNSGILCWSQCIYYANLGDFAYASF